MRFNHLEDWLRWQESLNPAEIDLGLERVNQVMKQAGLSDSLSCPVITVAGTNGKGSVVAMLEAIAMAAGLRVASYTSPHLFHYNERIRLQRQPVSDQQLCEAFERIDQARKQTADDSEPITSEPIASESTALTYFEFGTLAALDIFNRQHLDLVILEIGLGGRLDAVNVIQPSASIVTSIGIDHTDWLGNDRESIGREKAGIYRRDTPAVCADECPPASLLAVVEQLGAELLLAGKDYRIEKGDGNWALQAPFEAMENLPLPSLTGDFQLKNAAAAIVALQSVRLLPVNQQAIRQGLQDCRLKARFETIRQAPLVQVDVAHNTDAAKALVQQLQEDQQKRHPGACYAVFAMLSDKDVEQVVSILAPQVDGWYCAGLPEVCRGLTENQLIKRVRNHITSAKLCSAETVAEACEQVMQQVGQNDRVIIFGSFYTAAQAIDYFNCQQP